MNFQGNFSDIVQTFKILKRLTPMDTFGNTKTYLKSN